MGGFYSLSPISGRFWGPPSSYPAVAGVLSTELIRPEREVLNASGAETKDVWITVAAFLYICMAASCNEFPDSTKHGEISRPLKELLKLSFSSCCTESNVPRMR
jgi:hypothetical protein